MNQVMIDLETLSTRSDAKVLSIGAAIFNESEVIDTAGWAIDLADDVGGHVDWKTVKWWLEQSTEARQFSFNGGIKNTSAAFALKTFVAAFNVKEWWSKDPHFDHVILENWWRRTAEARGSELHIGDFPVGYCQPRAYRTLVGEASDLGYDAGTDRGFFVAHNPVDDAASQARCVIAARKFLRGIQR